MDVERQTAAVRTEEIEGGKEGGKGGGREGGVDQEGDLLNEGVFGRRKEGGREGGRGGVEQDLGGIRRRKRGGIGFSTKEGRRWR